MVQKSSKPPPASANVSDSFCQGRLPCMHEALCPAQFSMVCMSIDRPPDHPANIGPRRVFCIARSSTGTFPRLGTALLV